MDGVPGFVPRVLRDQDGRLFRAEDRVFEAVAPPAYDAPIYPTSDAPAATGDSAHVYVNPPDISDGYDHHPIRHQVCKHTIFC